MEPTSRILIIDDTPANLRVLGEMLEGIGHEVLIASSGPDALRLLEIQEPPQLILLDISMPGMDGFEVCRALKKRPETSLIPVVFMSAFDMVEHKLRAFREGGIDFISKPFQVEEVLARVETHVRLGNEIKSRIRSEERLLEVSKVLKKALEVAHLGYWTWHVKTNVLEWSDEMYTIFGVTRQDPTPNLTQIMVDRVHPEDRAKVEAVKRSVVEEAQSSPLEYRIIQPDGMIRTVWGKAWELVLDDDGNPALLKGIMLDVTERRTAEDERLRLERLLLQAQKLESIGRLAGGVAHDFNNLLVVMQGHAEMAMNRLESSDPSHEHFAQILLAARKSSGLTRQILTFSRQETSIPTTLDINDAMEGMLKLLRRLIGEDIQLVWKPSPGLWAVRVDPTQLDQILANLCVNARDAISGVGRIAIETANATFTDLDTAMNPNLTSGDFVRISVSDTGSGMDRPTLERVFEPFFSTKAIGHGTGLGLATVYGAVKANGGTVHVHSEIGIGSTFTIYLPRCRKSESLVARTQAISPSRLGKNECVLVVEDDESILNLTKSILEIHGYRVLCALNGTVAVELAKASPVSIELLLSDVILPDMNGHD
ncbi:MAG: response regulator, partial [Fibrobacterota bacterium]